MEDYFTVCKNADEADEWVMRNADRFVIAHPVKRVQRGKREWRTFSYPTLTAVAETLQRLGENSRVTITAVVTGAFVERPLPPDWFRGERLQEFLKARGET